MSPPRSSSHDPTNVMSNASLPCTIVYDERIVYYDASVRLKSSERGRNDANRVGFHLNFPPDQLFRGAHPVMRIDRSVDDSRPPRPSNNTHGSEVPPECTPPFFCSVASGKKGTGTSTS